MSTAVIVKCSEPDWAVFETSGSVVRHERIRSVTDDPTPLWRVVYEDALDARDAVQGLPEAWDPHMEADVLLLLRQRLRLLREELNRHDIDLTQARRLIREMAWLVESVPPTE